MKEEKNLLFLMPTRPSAAIPAGAVTNGAAENEVREGAIDRLFDHATKFPPSEIKIFAFPPRRIYRGGNL